MAQRAQEEPPTLKTEELISKLKSGSTEDTQDVALKLSEGLELHGVGRGVGAP